MILTVLLEKVKADEREFEHRFRPKCCYLNNIIHKLDD